MSQISRVSTDQKLIEMWLHNRPSSTASGYRRNALNFLAFVAKPLHEVALEDLQRYADYLRSQGLKESSMRTKVNNIKSLFTFATKLNYCRFNVAAALRVSKQSSSVSGRILNQKDVLRLIDAAEGRDKNLLKLIYATGMRVSEACRLKWSDFRERDDGSVQVTVLGKGSKIRSVIVPAMVWIDLEKGKKEGDGAVFKTNRGKPLDRIAAHKIIKKVAEVAGINPKVSIHWLRHSHCTHALNKGAPIALVRDSMGHSSIAVTDIYSHSSPLDSSSNYLGI
jgi:integrase/recombinase XerD